MKTVLGVASKSSQGKTIILAHNNIAGNWRVERKKEKNKMFCLELEMFPVWAGTCSIKCKEENPLFNNISSQHFIIPRHRLLYLNVPGIGTTSEI